MPNPQIQNDPIYSLPWLYIGGLNVSNASATVIAIAPGQARDSNDNIDMPVGFPNLLNITYPAPLYVNSAIVGPNGLDQGTLAAAATYGIWLIGDSRNYLPVAGLLSLVSNAFPLLPFGYDSMRLIGFATTSSSSFITGAATVSTALSSAFYHQPPIGVTASNATTFTAIDLTTGGGVPVGVATAAEQPIVILNVVFTPAAVGDTVQFRPTGSTATGGLVTIVGVAAGVPQVQQVQVVCGIAAGPLAEVDYKVTSSSDLVTVSVVGYIITNA